MTIKEIEQSIDAAFAKAGIMRATNQDEDQEDLNDPEPMEMSRILFRKDPAAERDNQIIEEVLQEIMDGRGVSREEAERILSNPW